MNSKQVISRQWFSYLLLVKVDLFLKMLFKCTVSLFIIYYTQTVHISLCSIKLQPNLQQTAKIAVDNQPVRMIHTSLPFCMIGTGLYLFPGWVQYTGTEPRTIMKARI